jgi:hypothetical protein
VLHNNTTGLNFLSRLGQAIERYSFSFFSVYALFSGIHLNLPTLCTYYVVFTHSCKILQHVLGAACVMNRMLEGK